MFALALYAMPVMAAGPEIVYDALPAVDPATSYPSQPFQAQQTSEFGDYIHLGGTSRVLDKITGTMVTWARLSEYASDSTYNTNDQNWTHPITVNVYSNHLGANGAPDQLLATVTQDTIIPWRPENNPEKCPDGFKWYTPAGTCANGLAFNAEFDLSSLKVTLPNDIIIGIAYNTQTYGEHPIGANGPYNSLNVAVPENQAVHAGSDDSNDEVFWNTSTAAWYTDSGTSGVGIFRRDWNWAPYGTVAFKVTALGIPTDKDQCKKDGWKNYVTPSGDSFKNQGDCVSFVNTGKYLMETLTVDSKNVSGAVSSAVMLTGKKYRFEVSGTWSNVGKNVADAEYASVDNWATYMNGYNINPYMLGEGEFDLQVNDAFVNWGSYSSAHTYSLPFMGNGSKVNFRVFDGDSTQTNPAPVSSWYGDNSGSLTVKIYQMP